MEIQIFEFMKHIIRFNRQVYLFLVPVALVSCLSQIVRLLAKGVNVEQWQKLARETA